MAISPLLAKEKQSDVIQALSIIAASIIRGVRSRSKRYQSIVMFGLMTADHVSREDE